MKVLHDWDTTYPNFGGLEALRQIKKWLLYLVGHKIPLMRSFNPVQRVWEEFAHEKLNHMETMLMLDELVGVTPILGIRDEVYGRWPQVFDELKNDGVEVRRHIHRGEYTDPNRTRLWIPPLKQTEDSWHYDSKYIAGVPHMLKRDELPIWHIGRPERLSGYIKFLHDIFKKGKIIHNASDLQE